MSEEDTTPEEETEEVTPKDNSEAAVTKKTAKKKTAKKKAVNSAPIKAVFDGKDPGFNLGKVLQERLRKSPNRKRKTTGTFNLAPDTRPRMVTIPDMVLQCLLRIKGWIPGTIVDVMGNNHVGKTTLMLTIAGHLQSQGIPCYYLNSQVKWPRDTWMKRCLSQDKQMAETYYENLMVDDVFTISDAIRQVDQFAIHTRKEAPELASVPLAVFVDSFSAMQDPDTAAGYVEYGEDVSEKMKASDKKKQKELEAMANFGHAKMAQRWTRRLHWLMWRYNLMFFLVEDTNTDVESQMKARPGTPTFMLPQEDENKTKIGGRAFNRSSAIQITLTEKGKIKHPSDTKTTLGRNISMRVVKNGYGRIDDKLIYPLRFDGLQDTADKWDRCLDLDYAFVVYLQENLPIMGIHEKDGLYYSQYVSYERLPMREFVNAIYRNPALTNWIGDSLGIYGYQDYKQPEAKPVEAPTEEEVEEVDGVLQSVVPEDMKVPVITDMDDHDGDNIPELYPSA